MKKTLIALSLIPSLAFSFTDAEKEIFMKENIKELERQGMMTPDSGIKVVPRASLDANEWQQKKDILARKEQNELGYFKENSSRAHELLHFKEFVKKRMALDAKMFKPYETHLRTKTTDMVMAYTFSGVPESDMIEYIGIAPAGTYVQSPVVGWSGAVQFFENKIGICAFTENNLNISHGAARIAEEDTRTDVNGKITLVDITGTDASGYLYRVKWFDSNFIRDLECANLKYSSGTTNAVIALANRIDSN